MVNIFNLQGCEITGMNCEMCCPIIQRMICVQGIFVAMIRDLDNLVKKYMK